MSFWHKLTFQTANGMVTVIKLRRWEINLTTVIGVNFAKLTMKCSNTILVQKHNTFVWYSRYADFKRMKLSRLKFSEKSSLAISTLVNKIGKNGSFTTRICGFPQRLIKTFIAYESRHCKFWRYWFGTES